MEGPQLQELPDRLFLWMLGAWLFLLWKVIRTGETFLSQRLNGRLFYMWYWYRVLCFSSLHLFCEKLLTFCSRRRGCFESFIWLFFSSFFFLIKTLCVNENYLFTFKLGLFCLFVLILPHSRKAIQTTVLNLANRNRDECVTTTSL